MDSVLFGQNSRRHLVRNLTLFFPTAAGHLEQNFEELFARFTATVVVVVLVVDVVGVVIIIIVTSLITLMMIIFIIASKSQWSVKSVAEPR